MSMGDIEDEDELLLWAESQSCADTTMALSSNKKSSLSVKKQNSWVSSAFEDFDDFGQSRSSSQVTNLPETTRSRKRPREQGSASSDSQKTKSVVCHDLWVDKHLPTTQMELAVHRKKVEEVQKWIEGRFALRKNKGEILLLTGPAGVGKTACIQVLAREMKFEIQEWINPTVTSHMDEDSWKQRMSDFAPVGGQITQSQVMQFQDFLLRANRYPTLQIFAQSQLHRKVILVEEYPNIFFRDAHQFHSVLRQYLQQHGQCPLVFIVSDSVGGESNERLLFPKDVQLELGIVNISFNPVAPTAMVKALQKIASLESKGNKTISVPDKSTLEDLAASSAGDIRGAINALQFLCLKGGKDVNVIVKSGGVSKSSKSKGIKTSSKNTRQKTGTSRKTKANKNGSEAEPAAIGGRDTSLFLFRALGKILYCKRNSHDENSPETELPSHLKHHYRDPLMFNPEDVIERSHLSGEFFAAYLHQNYLEFFSDLDDVIRSSEYFSVSDYLTADWSNRSVLRDYSASVAARGLIHCNSARARSTEQGSSKLGWKPLHKPMCYTVNKKCRENLVTARCLFRGHCWTPEDLLTNQLPYLSLINSSNCDRGQLFFLQELTKFSSKVYRSQAERLDEKDVDAEGEDEESLPSIVHNKYKDRQQGDSGDQVSADNVQDEEAVIEDFDD